MQRLTARNMGEGEFMLPDMDTTFRVFAAHWRRVEPSWSYPRHKHALFEVNLVLSGTQKTVVNRKTYVQHPGDLLLLNPGDEHESWAVGDEGMTYYCLHFDVDERAFRELMHRNRTCYHASDSDLARAIRPALDKLIELTAQESAARVEGRMMALSAMFELFGSLSAALSRQVGDRTAHGMTQTAARIAEYIERAIDRQPGGDGDGQETIASISAEVGYSLSSVNRMFSEVYGMSPRQYMSTLMLKKAKLLLMDPALTIEEISQRLGYHNIAHFSRQFKRWTGEPPSRFRSRFHE
ncbi:MULTISPECIES: helix-turn-helix domain-containing protein [Paenibacillus]|nr:MULTISPECIES: AraC family transcriptional regulator [Paenibacillus]